MVLYRVCFPFLRSEAQKWKTKKRGEYRSAAGKNAHCVRPISVQKDRRSSITQAGDVWVIEVGWSAAGIQELQQIELLRGHAGFHTVRHVELSVNAFQLGLDRVDGNDQSIGDFLVRLAGGKELEDA